MIRSACIPLLAVLGAGLAGPLRAGAQAPFIRGDFNQDGRLDLADPLGLLFHLFAGGLEPPCASAGDVNDDGAIGLTDGVGLLTYLFLSGSPPAAPFPGCGLAPGPLGCAQHAACAAEAAPELTEWPVPWPSSRPRDPYVDGLGRVWFVGQTADLIAFLEPASGRFTRFDLTPGTGPHNIVAGDAVWYAGNGAGHIGRLEPDSGAITVFPMPLAAAEDPHTLAFNREGDIWFTVQLGNFVGKLSTSSGQVRLIPVPTADARPYGIVVDAKQSPWFAEFGTNKIGIVDAGAFSIREFTLPRAGARPRRLGLTSDGSIWYVDYAQGYLGRFVPATGQVQEWRTPGGSQSRPYGMAVDHLDRVWFVETGAYPNRLVGFHPPAERFFGSTPIQSGGGTVRHMYFHGPSREIWFGTDTNTVGRARIN